MENFVKRYGVQIEMPSYEVLGAKMVPGAYNKMLQLIRYVLPTNKDKL